MARDAVASLYMVNLDCADPRSMAAFYSALLGGRCRTAKTSTR